MNLNRPGLTVLLPLCFTVASSHASDQPPGRFQMAGERYSGRIVVLDTATGQVWSKIIGGDDVWVDEGNPTKPQKPKPKEPITLKLPKEKVELTIRQRSSRAIPGSQDKIRVYLGDITGQQVVVTVRDLSWNVMLPETSLEQHQVVSFKVNEEPYYLQLSRLTNVLIGDDLAVVEIASDKSLLTKPAKKDEGEKPKARKSKTKRGND